MGFNLQFQTSNAAFTDPDEPTRAANDAAKGEESARILSKIMESVAYGERRGSVHDVNGNTIGSWSLS